MDENTLKDMRGVLEQSTFPFELVGAVVFGSRVKGKCIIHSDLDILIIADGVNPKDVYQIMDTPEGIDRAFAKLDEIKTSTSLSLSMSIAYTDRGLSNSLLIK